MPEDDLLRLRVTKPQHLYGRKSAKLFQETLNLVLVFVGLYIIMIPFIFFGMIIIIIHNP